MTVGSGITPTRGRVRRPGRFLDQSRREAASIGPVGFPGHIEVFQDGGDSVQWPTMRRGQQPHGQRQVTLSRSDLDIARISELVRLLPADEYNLSLIANVRALVYIAVAGHPDFDGPPEEAVESYIRERLGQGRSDSFAARLVSMARENDAEFDHWLFSDDREEMLLVADSELTATGVILLEHYLDYRDNYPAYGIIHPSALSGPMEDDEDAEWARLVAEFTSLARDWRDGFLKDLIEDVNRVWQAEGLGR